MGTLSTGMSRAELTYIPNIKTMVKAGGSRRAGRAAREKLVEEVMFANDENTA